jgi:hypothetical protein
MQITAPGNPLPPVIARSGKPAERVVGHPDDPAFHPKPKGYGAMTQGYFKTQIAALEAQSAQITRMMAEHPTLIGNDPSIASTLADNKRYIDTYTKAMATAPKGPGDFVMFSGTA